MPSKLIDKYIREDHLPHIWCPGCGHGILMRDVAQAVSDLELDQEKVFLVSGIGCSSRAAGYMDFNTLHTTHGRALAFATGIKLARPDLNVIVIAGDGDIAAIGGNHLIHAARRNIDMTVIVFNNDIYGMTGGQFSPTTPTGDYATTAPYGNIDRPFDIARLAEAAGATYTARGTAYHAALTIKLIKEGMLHRGFSLIECASVCPTYYGRKNKKGGSVELMTWQKDNCILSEKAEKMTKEELEGKLVIGKLSQRELPEYTDEYRKIIEKAGGNHV